jgi:predicted dehydrogenase
MLGSNWKFHPGPKRLKQIVDSGDLGRIVAVQSIGGQYLPDWHPWEDYRQMYSSRSDLSGGVLLDCHDIDYLTWLLGPIKNVNCRMVNTNTLEISTSDLATMVLEFESGALGSVQIDYLQRPNARRVHISGSNGIAIWDFTGQIVRSYDAGSEEWSDYTLASTYDINQMYVDEAVDFLDCISEGRTPETPIDQAAHVMAVFDAISSSASNDGKTSEVIA